MTDFNVLELLGIAHLPDTFPSSFDDLPDPLLSGIKTPTPAPSPLPGTSNHNTAEDTPFDPGPDLTWYLPPPPPVVAGGLSLPGGSPDDFRELFDALSQPSSTTLTAQSASSPPASSAFNLFSPNIRFNTVGSPTAPKRRGHIPDKPKAMSPYQRPASKSKSKPKPKRSPLPGEASFQLDKSVTPLPPPLAPSATPVVQPNSPKSRGVAKYAACKCPGGLTTKPLRHWRRCPYNPERDDEEPIACPVPGCQVTCTSRKDNMKRHVADYHPEWVLNEG